MHQNRVLVIDDEEDMRHLIEMYLLNSGFLCTQAANGAEALQVFKDEQIDVVLLDIMMPEQDGFSVCESVGFGAEFRLCAIAMIFCIISGFCRILPILSSIPSMSATQLFQKRLYFLGCQ